MIGIDRAVLGGDAKAGRGVPLRVQIDNEDRLLYRGERCCSIDRGGGLAHAALLIGYGEDA